MRWHSNAERGFDWLTLAILGFMLIAGSACSSDKDESSPEHETPPRSSHVSENAETTRPDEIARPPDRGVESSYIPDRAEAEESVGESSDSSEARKVTSKEESDESEGSTSSEKAASPSTSSEESLDIDRLESASASDKATGIGELGESAGAETSAKTSKGLGLDDRGSASSAGSGTAAKVGDLEATSEATGPKSAKKGSGKFGAVKGRGSVSAHSGERGKKRRASAHHTTTASPPEQAGQLTASLWLDLRNWDFWRDLFQSDEWGDKWQSFAEVWSIELRHRISVHVEADGEPVADARVSLLSPNGEQLWTTRTDHLGHAVLFPTSSHDLSTEERQGEWTVQATSGEGNETLRGIELNRDRIGLDLERADQPAPAVDVRFVVDTTGSMSDELRYLETELSSVVDRVRGRIGQEVGLRFGTTFYRDTQDDYVVRSHRFTQNVSRVVGQLAGEKAAGGGDKPEAVDRALAKSLKQDWSEQARARLLFLVLDAPPHQSSEAIERIRRATRRAAERGIHIIPVVGSGIDKNTEYLMRSMALATHGSYVFLTDDSGIGGEHIEPTVGDYDVHKLNDILVDLIATHASPPPQ